MNDPSPKPTDLKWHIVRAMDYIKRWAYPLVQLDPDTAIAEGYDDYWGEQLSHNVGRAIDGLLKGLSVTEFPVETQLLDVLRSVLFASLDNDVGFPAAYCRE